MQVSANDFMAKFNIKLIEVRPGYVLSFLFLLGHDDIHNLEEKSRKESRGHSGTQLDDLDFTDDLCPLFHTQQEMQEQHVCRKLNMV